jgi:hypothetical protein
MVRLAASLLVISSLACAAFAQEGDTARFRPEWEQRPSARDFADNYPRDALRNVGSGVGVLCCSPRSDRSLECTLAREFPEARGLGEASVRVANSFKLTEASYATYQSGPRARIRLPVRWNSGTPSEEASAQVSAFLAETRNVCEPASSQGS